MSVAPAEQAIEEVKLDLVDLSPHIATEVKGLDLAKPLDAATIAALRKVWVHRAVLVIRGQKLSQEDLLRFTKYFGELGARGRPAHTFPSGYAKVLPDIMLISNIRENGQTIGALPDGEMHFHHDMIHVALPHNASILYLVEVPSYGGDTCFAAGHAAYDTLDPAIKARLEGKRAFNHYQYNTTKRGDTTGSVDAISQAVHPVFRTHDETGRKAIYVNRLMTVGIIDMPPAESEPLLAAVFDHAERRDFVYEHVWRVGDLLLWDNRCSSHARTDFPSSERRLMLRTTVKGTVRPY
jgi:taurine dioxygenase